MKRVGTFFILILVANPLVANVRLQFSEVIRGKDPRSTFLEVRESGQVVLSQCRKVNGREVCSDEKIRDLSESELRRIDARIDRAKVEKLIHVNDKNLCKSAAQSYVTYSADNGRIVLYDNRLGGGCYCMNASASASQLIRQLDLIMAEISPGPGKRPVLYFE